LREIRGRISEELFKGRLPIRGSTLPDQHLDRGFPLSRLLRITNISIAESTTELISGQYGGTSAQLIYGTFTTPVNSISGSAVCAFSLQDIADSFAGNFKEQTSGINSNWLSVPDTKVPDPRPGQCTNDSRTLPDLTLNFINAHSLMDESVPSFFGQPIVIRTSFQ